MDKVNAVEWRKSKRCGNAACVEVARVEDGYLVRDSKNPDLLPFFFNRAEVSAFLDGAKKGEFDSLLGSDPRVLDLRTMKSLVILLAGFTIGMASGIFTVTREASSSVQPRYSGLP